jgi:hypothetical protein
MEDSMNNVISNKCAYRLLAIDHADRKRDYISGLSMQEKIQLAEWWRKEEPVACDTPLQESDGTLIADGLLDDMIECPTVMGVMRAVESLTITHT